MICESLEVQWSIPESTGPSRSQMGPGSFILKLDQNDVMDREP